MSIAVWPLVSPCPIYRGWLSRLYEDVSGVWEKLSGGHLLICFPWQPPLYILATVPFGRGARHLKFLPQCLQALCQVALTCSPDPPRFGTLGMSLSKQQTPKVARLNAQLDPARG